MKFPEKSFNRSAIFVSLIKHHTMKKVLLSLGIFSMLLGACKKESTTDNTIVRLKTITYTHPTNPLQNKTYTVYRNSADLIDSVVLTASDASGYRHFSFFHTAGRLDSIVQYNSTGAWVQTAPAVWSGDKLVAFWTLAYTYDGQQRITQKLYTNGSLFHVEHFADSSVFHYDPIGTDPEYKSYVQYYNKSLLNPFRMYKYENAYPISNLIFNNISSDFFGTYTYPFGDYNVYNSSGARTTAGTYVYSGNFHNYPTSMQNVANGTLNFTLTFTYE